MSGPCRNRVAKELPVPASAGNPAVTDGVHVQPVEAPQRGIEELVVAPQIDDDGAVSVARLRYRHVDQEENYESVEMRRVGSGFLATIPAAYTKTEFPLEYFFELTGRQGARGIVRAVPVAREPGGALVGGDQRRIGLQGLGVAAGDPRALPPHQGVRHRPAPQRVAERLTARGLALTTGAVEALFRRHGVKKTARSRLKRWQS